MRRRLPDEDQQLHQQTELTLGKESKRQDTGKMERRSLPLKWQHGLQFNIEWTWLEKNDK